MRVVGFDVAIAECSDEKLRPFLSAIDVDSLPTHLATEVAFAWDWKARTAREIGRNIGRDYAGHLARTGQAPLGPTEIPLTTDLLGVDTVRRHGYAGDYKTGRTRYPLPEQFAQTLLAGLCVRHVYDCDEVSLEVIYILGDGDDYRSRGLADAWILDDFADDFARAMELAAVYELEHAAGRELPVNEGDHCDYCPAFKSCRAKVGLVSRLPSKIDELMASGYLSRDRLAEAWHLCERMKQLIGAIQTEICMQSTRGPIDLGDGTILAVYETRRESYNGKIAAAVLEERYGKEAVDEAAEVSISKDALRTAVAKRRAPNEKISTKKGDGVLDRVENEIRRRNGIEVSITSKPSVRKAKALPKGETA